MRWLPGCAFLGHDTDNVFGAAVDLTGCERVIADCGGTAQCTLHHGRQRAVAAQNADGFASPGGALLGVRAGFVLAVTGGQSGSLRQVERFGGRGFSAVVGLERGGQFTDHLFDGGSSRRPGGHQPGVNSDDFADRALASISWFNFGERDSEQVRQVRFEAGVVALGGRDDGLVQRAAIDGHPPGDAVCASDLHLVADGHVGM